MHDILCLIPARSGSKSIPNKNILLYNGQPMLTWSIKQAKESKYKMKIVVSTDSLEYQKIAIDYGAECPFIRPRQISQDDSTDFEFILHALEWLKTNENYIPNIIVHLRPTYPNRSSVVVDMCIDEFIDKFESYDSLRTVIPFDKSPYKMYNVVNNALVPLFESINNINEPYNQARQLLPQCYLHNGCVDVIKTETIYKHNSVTGKRILSFIMDKNEDNDIDTNDDLEKSKKHTLFSGINNEFVNNKKYYDELKENIINNINGRIPHHRIAVLHIICKLYVVKSYLEIGVHNGASMSYVVRDKNQKVCYGIDLFESTTGHYVNDKLSENRTKNNILNNNISSTINLIKGNSFLSETIDKLKVNLNGKLIDLLFIDGDHSYDGVRNDFINYEKFVKKNGFIVIDDYEPNYPQIIKFVNDYVASNENFAILGVFENNELIILKK